MNWKRIAVIAFIAILCVDFTVAAKYMLSGNNTEAYYDVPSTKSTKQRMRTATPFMPVENTPTVSPTLGVTSAPAISPTLEVTIEPTKEILEEPENIITNKYEYNGIRFDEPSTVEITIYFESGEVIEIVSIPYVFEQGENDVNYKAGMGIFGVFADESGNITLNLHSGCYKVSGSYVDLEMEGVRRYVEGGECLNIFAENPQSVVDERIENLKNANIEITQNEKTVFSMKIIDIEKIDYEYIYTVTMDPFDILKISGINYSDSELRSRKLIIITSGWDTKKNIWTFFSNERWIFVLEKTQE